MKIAVSVFRNVISPRLDSSDSLLIYHIDNAVVNKKEKWCLDFDQPAQLISILQKEEITTVICGGCPQFFLRMLFFHGFDVMAGLTGDPDSIIKMLMKGELNVPPLMNSFKRPCKHKNRMRRNINNEKRKKIKTEVTMPGYGNKSGGGQGGGNGMGAGGSCVCLKCGYTESKKIGIPCMKKKCPHCGSVLMRRYSKHYQKAMKKDK